MEKFLVSLSALIVCCLCVCEAAAVINEEEQQQDVLEEQVAQPYFWPHFPFVPGANFPPSMPPWMTERRPTAPPLPDFRLPPVRLPWPHPDDDDSDSDEEDEAEECPRRGIHFIAYPDDCKKYILCIDGDKISTLKCPNGFHFSRALRGCTHPEEAKCE